MWPLDLGNTSVRRYGQLIDTLPKGYEFLVVFGPPDGFLFPVAFILSERFSPRLFFSWGTPHLTESMQSAADFLFLLTVASQWMESGFSRFVCL